MEKSSIEWYAKQLAKIGLTDEVIGHLTKEAIEMHKQEIIEAYRDGVKDGINYYIDSEWGNETKLIDCEEYYKNTYEKEN